MIETEKNEALLNSNIKNLYVITLVLLISILISIEPIYSSSIVFSFRYLK